METDNITRLYRPHPITILSNLYRYLLLLLLPVLRGFLHALTGGGIASWLSGAWLDLGLLGLFLSFGVLTWYRFTLESAPQGLTIRRGLFLQESFFLPQSRYSCITLVEPLYLRPLGGCFLRIDTPAGNLTQADLTVFLRKRHCRELLEQCSPQPGPRRMTKEYSPRNVYVFVLAAITSNSFAGVVIISAFISQSGKILGRQFSELLYGTFEEAAKALAFGVPPAAAAVAYLLLFGYLCAFALSLLRHAGFRVRRTRNLLEIQAGAFTRRTYRLEKDKLSFVDIRRTLLTMALGLSSVFLYIPGYGKYKDDLSSLIPCANSHNLKTNLNLLLPEYSPSPRTVKPHWRSITRYCSLAFFTCLGVLGAAWGCYLLFPQWRQLTFWLGFLCLCPSVWYLVIRVLDYLTAGISYRRGCFTLRYGSRFTLHQVVLPSGKIAKIRLTQNPLQQRNGRCDLYLYSVSEGLRPHRVRDLPREEAEALFQVGGIPGMGSLIPRGNLIPRGIRLSRGKDRPPAKRLSPKRLLESLPGDGWKREVRRRTLRLRRRFSLSQAKTQQTPPQGDEKKNRKKR